MLFDLRNTIDNTDFRQVHSFTMKIGVGEQLVDLARERRNNNWPVVYYVLKSIKFIWNKILLAFYL